MKKTIIISLGGSIIAPKPGFIDLPFIMNFRKLIIDCCVNKNYQVVIVTGGGKLNKAYNQAVKKIIKTAPVELDRLGIAATRFHAEFLRIIFGKYAYAEILLNPTKKIITNKHVILAAGWKPGCSTDKDAVLLAKTYGSQSVINLTNIDFVYTQDPTKYKNARKISDTTWAAYRRVIPKKWSPKLCTPFDPVASRSAQRQGITVVIMNGRRIKQIGNILSGKSFKGTVIHP